MENPTPTTSQEPGLTRPERIVAGISGGLAALLGLVGFAGSYFGSRIFLLESGQRWIDSNVALSIILLGSALPLWLWPRARSQIGCNAAVRAGLMVLGLANLLLVLAQTVLPEILGSAPYQAWEVLIQSAAARAAGYPVNHSSPVVAGLLVLAAATLIGLWHESGGRHRWHRLSLAVSLVTLAFSVVCTLGSNIDQTLFHTEVPHGTATVLALLSLGVAVACGLRPAVASLIWALPERTTVKLPAAALRTQARLLWTGLSLLALLSIVTYLHLRSIVRAGEQEVAESLENVTSLKIAQVQSWRNERSADAMALIRLPGLAADLARLTSQPDDGPTRERLTSYLETFRRADDYRALVLYNAALQPIAAVPSGAERTETVLPETLVPASARPEATTGELKRDFDRNIYLDIMAPIPTATGGFGGIALLRVDARAELFPMFGSWPGASHSSETMLIWSDPNFGVHANDVLLEPESAANFLPVRQPQLVGELAGATAPFGLKTGVDFLGKPIFGVSRPIAGTPWTILTKVELTEANSAVRSEVLRDGTALGAVLLVFGLTFSRLWLRRQGELVENQRQTEQRRLLADARLHLVMQQTNDVILLFDETQIIRDANERVQTMYGWSPEEMRGMALDQIRAPDGSAPTAVHFPKTLAATDGMVFERTHRRRDGTTFPVEISSRPVMLDGRPHVLCVMRDITERKVQIQEIERLGQMYATISRVNQSLLRAKNRNELFGQVCRALTEGGLFKLAWVGWLDSATQRIQPVACSGDTEGFLDDILISVDPSLPEGRGPEGRAFRGDHTYVCNDFLANHINTPWHPRAVRSGIRASISLPLRQAGRPHGLLVALSVERDAFHAETVSLLEKSAEEISYGLDTFALREHQLAAEQALLASESRLKFLLTATPAVIFSFSASSEKRTNFLSPNVKAVLGYEVSDFTDSPDFWRKHVHPEDLPRADAVITFGLAKGSKEERLSREYRFRHQNGTWRWMREGLGVVRDEQGQPREFVGFWTDVTELRQSEDAVRANEERLRLALEATHLGIFDFDVVSGQASVNSEYALMLGHDPATFAPTFGGWVSGIHPEERAHALASLDACLAGKSEAYRFEFRMRTKTGDWRWISCFGKLVSRNPDGTPRRMLGTHADITQRKSMEDHLRKLSRTIEQAPVGVIITNLTGTIEYANPKFCEMTGYTVNEVIGRNPRFLKSGETPPETYRRLWGTILRGGIWVEELRNRRKDGEHYPEVNIIAPLLDDTGRPTHFVAFKDDIAARRRQEAESASMLAKERELSEMKTRFISVTSHEFRTPMAAAMGSIELLLNHADRLTPAKTNELLGRTNGSLRRMADMLDDVLTLNRMDTNRVEIRFMAIDVGRLVQDAIEEARLADRGAHQFDLQLTGENQPFATDPNLLRHVLTNLLSNAVRYSPVGTVVTVTLAFSDQGVRLTVEDRGIGIPAADHDRLFQPFERGSNVGNIKGTGLGLSIVRRMTTLLGGTVGFSPGSEGGTRFAIELPRRQELPVAR
jgi:PAS domain S-box-containing protein